MAGEETVDCISCTMIEAEAIQSQRKGSYVVLYIPRRRLYSLQDMVFELSGMCLKAILSCKFGLV